MMLCCLLFICACHVPNSPAPQLVDVLLRDDRNTPASFVMHSACAVGTRAVRLSIWVHPHMPTSQSIHALCPQFAAIVRAHRIPIDTDRSGHVHIRIVDGTTYGIGLLTTAFVHPLNAVTPLNNESDIIYVNGAASLLYDQKMNNDLKNLMHVLVHEHRHLEQFAHICRANRTCTHDAPLRRYAYEPLIHQELRVFSEGDAVYATCRVTSTSCLDDLVTLHPRSKRPSKRTTCTAVFARGSYGCAYALVAEITKDFLNALTTKHRANPPDWFGAVLRMPNAMSHPVRFAHVLRAVFATFTTYKEYDIHASGADVRAYAWLYTHTMMRRCGARSCPGT